MQEVWDWGINPPPRASALNNVMILPTGIGEINYCKKLKSTSSLLSNAWVDDDGDINIIMSDFSNAIVQ